MQARLITENPKGTEHTENREKQSTARANIELSVFSPCLSGFLCALCSENTAKPLRISGEMTQYFHAHRVSHRIMTDCVEFRGREYSEE